MLRARSFPGGFALAAAAMLIHPACAPDVVRSPGQPSTPYAPAATVAPISTAWLSASAASTPPAPTPPAAIAPATEPLLDDGAVIDPLFPKGDARALGLDGAALDNLVRAAASTETDALIVIKDGKTVVHRTFGNGAGALETMSVTKSISAIAVGLLVDEGKIRSLDEPLSTWFPGWSKGLKGRVTLRHVLTQTSGLAHQSSTSSLNGQRDRLAYAAGLEVRDEPGTVFSYNNEASQLVSGIVRKAAGQPIDSYLRDKLFRPLGIEGWSWTRDKAGNVQTYYGLHLTAAHLARIGAMMEAGGMWEGRRILSEQWVKASASQGTPANDYYGLLWWLRFAPPVRVQTAGALKLVAQAGFGEAEALAPLTDKQFATDAAYWLEAGALLGPGARAQLARLAGRGLTPLDQRPGVQLGFYADGWLGQRLAVYPQWHIVAVRTHKARHGGNEAESKAYGMAELLKLVEATVSPMRD